MMSLPHNVLMLTFGHDFVLQAADVLDYVPVFGKVFRFASTAILGYYHQFHFYTSAS